MNSTVILDYIKRRMFEMGYQEKDYTLTPQQYTVALSSSAKITDGTNDIHFLSNIFSTRAAPLSGSIVADDNADSLNPLFLNKEYTLLQAYRGTITVTNGSALGNLYVEFIRVSFLSK